MQMWQLNCEKENVIVTWKDMSMQSRYMYTAIVDQSGILTPIENSVCEATRLTRFIQTTRSSGSLHIPFKLGPVHSSTSSNHCLPGLPRDLSSSTLPWKIASAMIPFPYHDMSKPSEFRLSNLQQWVILPIKLCNSLPYISTWCYFVLSYAPSTVSCSNCFQKPGCVSAVLRLMLPSKCKETRPN